MYDIKPNLIIGFHGCDRRVRDTLLLNPNQFKISRQPYDWLGHGLYFWENNYDRALQWAVDKKAHGKIAEPSVIGAVLHLGYCCDLLRYLDCAVIEIMHQKTLDQAKTDIATKGNTRYKIFDSIRAAFIEGGPAFEGTQIREKTHIQICIRNPNCIKGFFLPRREIDFAPWQDIAA